MNNGKLKVHINQYFDSSPEIIFDAWIKPEIAKCWLFASPTNEIAYVLIDPRIGGSFSILELNNGNKIDHFGEYLEIDRPHRLAFSLEVPWHFPGVTKVTVSIRPKGNGSELTFTQAGVSPETTEANWRDMFRNLGELLKRKYANKV